MTICVVFKTPGKLDLRSLTTFGLNAKPATGHPIGFFGTGLKYAIAVLSRHNILITLYIDGKKWTVESKASNFRGKEFKSLYIKNDRQFTFSRALDLPFTTDLGKTWKLWQAFRELYSNTLDENGETRIGHSEGSTFPPDMKGQTFIVVESEAFVEEFFNRERTFLPEGLTKREGSERLQIFDRPSRYIYYRGIRVLDLKEEERSELTYNILAPIELTEDRTAKSKWDVEYLIQQELATSKNKDQLAKVVGAPKRSFEGDLNFYAAPSKEFLDVAESMPSETLTNYASAHLKLHRPPKVKATNSEDWYEELIQAITTGDDGDNTLRIIEEHREAVTQALREAQLIWQKETTNNEQREVAGSVTGRTTHSANDPVFSDEASRAWEKENEGTYDIPF